MPALGAPPDESSAFVQSLKVATILRAERLVQSFMPSVEVLKLLLTFDGRQLEGVFLRQRITSRLPSLWPLLDMVGNLYDFLEALPGVLDMTPDAVLGYGIFFANEAIVGEEGPFAAYPDFASLPELLQLATRRRFPELVEHFVSEAQAASAEEMDIALLARAVAQLEGALAGSEPKRFSQLTYDPDKDDYCFDAFFVYESALFAATIRVNRKTGEPRMDSDAALGVTDPDVIAEPRPPRLPQMHLWGGFSLRPPASGKSTGLGIPLRALTDAEASEILLETGQLENAEVAGDITLLESSSLPSLHLRNCSVEGSLILNGAHVTGNLAISESHIGGACRLKGIRVDGDIDIGRSTDDGTFIKLGLDLSGSHVGGDVILEGVHVGGGVSMIMGSVGGTFRIGAPHGAVQYRDHDSTIGQDLSLAHCDIKGPLTLRGIQLFGSLRLEMCSLGAVIVEGRLVSDWAAEKTRLLPSIIGGWLQIVACAIRGQLKLSALCVDKNYGAHYAIEIVSSTIGQGVTFWDEQLADFRSADDVAAYLGPPSGKEGGLRRGWRFEPSVSPSSRGGWPVAWGEFSNHQTLAAGAFGTRPGDHISLLELRADLSAQHISTQAGGDVRVALSKIGGDFSLTNLRAPGQRLILEGIKIDGDLLADWTGHRYTVAHKSPPDSWLQQYVGLLSTTAATLEADGVTVQGEARLAGLRLTGNRDEGSSSSALRFVSSTVERVIRLADFYGERGAQADVRSRARLDGDLNVSWSNIGHLVLDGRSLGVPSTRPEGNRRAAPLNRFVAANATIRKLEMVDPPPGEIDLLDANVTFWDFGPVDALGMLEFFHRVLRNQQPFRRNVYQEVEAYLHNIGHEDYAKDVRRALVARQHREAFDRAWQGRGSLRAIPKIIGASLRSAASRVNRLLTGNLTSEWRPLLYGWLPLWLGASLYFVNPARVAIAAEQERQAAAQIAAGCATLGRWTFWDSMHFSARYVIPIVPSVGMEDLSAADQLQTHSSCPEVAARSNAKRWLDWLRPSTFATVVRILSWLFLSLATGTIFAKLSRVPRSSR